MEPYIFTDAAGVAWEVIDYKVIRSPQGERGKKKRLPLGDWSAEGRAFVPIGRKELVMLHHFGYTPYRDLTPKILQNQLASAKPSTATPAERMQGNQ